MYKSELQAVCQQRGWELPTYQVTKQGQDHKPLFSATVTVNAISFTSPSPSSSSKKAQSDAAKLAYDHFSLISSSPPLSVSAGCSCGSTAKNTRPSHENPTPLSNANPTLLSNEAGAVAKTDKSFGGYLGGSTAKNTRQSYENLTPLSNEVEVVAKTDKSFGGYLGGSTAKNTRQSYENPTPLSNANPTLLSNEAGAVAKTDKSFGGYSSGSIAKNTHQSHENPTPLSNDVGVVAKTDKSFGGYLGGSIAKNTRQSYENPTPLSNEVEAVAKTDKSFGGMVHLFKNQLQTYAQKRNFSLPVYSCERIGPPHAILFKCKVTVNGKTYESREYFPTLSKAENAAAKAALMSMLPNGVEEDESGYKNLLQDMAQREGCGLPTYCTEKSGEAHAPTFISTVVIDGVTFTGKEARTKKQAEMSAAKTAYTARRR